MSLNLIKFPVTDRSKWVDVDLTWQEIEAASQHGLNRSIRNGERGAKHAHGAKFSFLEGVTTNVGASIGELAVAKHFNFYHSGIAYIGAPDVGGCIEVRAITKEHHGLILHPDDPENFIAICAYIKDPSTVHLVGWIAVADGKTEQFEAEPQQGRPCYLVPQSKLHPMSSMRSRLKQMFGRFHD